MRTIYKQMEMAGVKLQTLGKSCRALCLLGLAAVVLSACAGQQMERPVAQLTRAEAAIESAIQAGARQAAPLELQNAQRDFSQAQRASTEEEFAQAMRLAEKAEASANLAESKARAEMAQADLAELQEGVRVLEEELQRTTN